MKNYQLTKVDPQNRINDLSNEDWLRRTSSFRVAPEQKRLYLELYPYLHQLRKIISERLGPDAVEALFGNIVPSVKFNPRNMQDRFSRQHPAPFDVRDIKDLIELLTKRGNKVVDPFAGTSTTLEACYKTGRIGAGIELFPRWIAVSAEKLSEVMGTTFKTGRGNQYLFQGDCRQVLSGFQSENVDLVITSPPYFNFFKSGRGDRRQRRLQQGLAVDYGESPLDIGGISDITEHAKQLNQAYLQCHRILKPGKFMVLIVHDMARQGLFIPYHMQMMFIAYTSGFNLRGIQIIIDDWKRLKDYGIPRRFFLNFTHHYALIFQK